MLSREKFIYTGHANARKGDSRLRLAQLVGDRHAVVDAGCAVGYIGEHLRAIQSSRWLAGIEIDPTAAEQARTYYDQVIVGSLEDESVWNRLERDVDAMIFGDVLEHTSDPIRVLRMAGARMKADGVVVISMPNIAHFRIRLNLLAGRFDYQEWGIMDRTHLRFFTLASATKMVEASGFEVTMSEAIAAYPPVEEGPVISRLGRAGKARVRRMLGVIRPTLFANQFILVGRKSPLRN